MYSEPIYTVSSWLDSAPRAPLRLPFAWQRVRPHLPLERCPFLKGRDLLLQRSFIMVRRNPFVGVFIISQFPR